MQNLVQSNALYNVSPLPTYMGSGDGALTFLFAPDLLLEANIVQGNAAVFGAGVCLRSCFAARVQNNVIVNNLAYDFSGFGGGGEGGGLLCDVNVNATGNVVIANNTLVGNNAPPTFLGHFGGGMAVTLYTNGLILANNIVASNSSGIWRYPYLSYQPVLQHNCVNNSNANNYVNLSAGPTDIQADPQFVNRAVGDFHLLPSSPCINGGTNSVVSPGESDFDGQLRVAGGIVDIGADEFGSGLPFSLNLRLDAGQPRVGLRGETNRVYVVEASPNLRDWTAISTNQMTNAFFEITDPDVVAGNRFYRVFLKP